MFKVTGGVYTDTTFTKLESDPEEYGPFQTYKEAYDVWKGKMGWKVDTCCHRLFIIPKPVAP
jgi:hypothetical protein